MFTRCSFLLSYFFILSTSGIIAQLEHIDSDVLRPYNLKDIVVIGEKMFFSAEDASNNFELWVTDGTSEGTFMVKDIRSQGSSLPERLTEHNNMLFFIAQDNVNGTQLWRSDGTEEGTRIVYLADTTHVGGVTRSACKDLQSTPNGLLYVASERVKSEDEMFGKELWISDGTQEGTHMLIDLLPGDSGSAPGNFGTFNGQVVFMAKGVVTMNGKTFHGLYQTDGTADGTHFIDTLAIGYHSIPDVVEFIPWGGGVYFNYDDDEHGMELWRSKGDSGSTEMVIDLMPGDRDGIVNNMQFIPYENTLLFNGRNSIVNNNDLFVLNKQDDSISVLLEVNNSSFSDGVLNWKRYRNMIFLIVSAGPMQQGLWRTDGTPEGTTRIKRLNISEPGGPIGPEAQMTVSDNKLFFGASIQSYGLRLYRSQGTEATTQPFDVLQYPGILGEVADKLILFGSDTEYSNALFSLDVDQTTLTKNSLTIDKIKIFPNPASSQIQISGLTDETGTVMLSDALGRELGRWRFAAVGTLTIQLNDKYPSGLYFIVVETRNGIRTHKIFIK